MTNTNSQSGFTLVEMLVAIAVALVFVGGMLFSRGDFDSTVRLGSITREVALVVREAQNYGAGGGSETNIDQPHGIYLDSASSSHIKLYADQDGSPGYDSTGDDLLEQVELPDRYRIDTFCVSNNPDHENCSASPVVEPNDLSIYFQRPSLSANFYSDSANASSSQKGIIDLIHEDSGNKRSVIVDTTGFITVP